ncbi:MAG: type 1 periplasmic binding fold superfamily protein [Rhodothermales bacterium]|nr:type 1 periplasmic binding fold superfamily protein [Rhodothermales bacterium]
MKNDSKLNYFTTLAKHAILFSLAIGLIVLSGCDSNEPDPDAGEQEVITDIIMTLTNETTGSVTSARAEFDEAGVLQSVETVSIQAGTTHSVSMEFLNEIEGDDITEEIEEEDEFHQLVYAVGGSAAARTTITNRDTDGNGNPLGLSFTLTDTGATASSGTINVTLRHYEEDAQLPDDKVNDDGGSEIPGIVENDVDVTFPLSITV